jgi:cbb3-type cytochrome oxidase subunit 3
MDLDALVAFARSMWVVWLMAIFIAIVVRAFWPSRKRRLEAYARIPLADDEER